MRETLLDLGHPRVETIDISAFEWLPALLAGSSFTFFLNKLDRLARELEDNQSSGGNRKKKLSIVGHSAGGWLARIWLGAAVYDGTSYQGSRLCDTLLTLGTPHLSVEEYPFGRVLEARKGQEGPMTEKAKGSSLSFANEFCGASDLRNEKEEGEGLEIICVAGNGYHGKEGGWATRASYKCTCRKEDVDGDGVCPIESAILPGCDSSVVLDKVFHSPTNQSQNKLWYGDQQVVQKWDKLLP
jgi:hypothetical protein